MDVHPPVRVLRAHFTRCTPEWHWINPPGRLDGFLFWLILKGRGRLKAGEREFTLHPGQCFLMRMWEPIEGEHDPTQPLLVPWLHFEYLDDQGRVVHPDPLPRFHRRAEGLSFLSDLLRRAIDAFDEDRPAAAAHWMGSVLLEVAQQDRAPPPGGAALDQAQRIERLCLALREHPDMRLPVADMARQLHCSPDHFTRIFKRVKGESPSAFQLRTRLEHAKSLLRFSSHPVGRIAEMLGYRDVHFFSRQFRLHAGCSPTTYRLPPK